MLPPLPQASERVVVWSVYHNSPRIVFCSHLRDPSNCQEIVHQQAILQEETRSPQPQRYCVKSTQKRCLANLSVVPCQKIFPSNRARHCTFAFPTFLGRDLQTSSFGMAPGKSAGVGQLWCKMLPCWRFECLAVHWTGERILSPIPYCAICICESPFQWPWTSNSRAGSQKY